MSRNKEHRSNGAAAEGGRPLGGAAEGGASVFFVSAHLISYIMYIYGDSLHIPVSEVGGVSPTGKSMVSCAESGCTRRCASCRWVARRQHVLLLRSFSLMFFR